MVARFSRAESTGDARSATVVVGAAAAVVAARRRWRNFMSVSFGEAGAENGFCEADDDQRQLPRVSRNPGGTIDCSYTLIYSII